MNKNKLTVPDIYILVSLFMFTVWEVFCGFILKVDAAARTPHVLIYSSLLAALLFCDGRKLLRQNILLLWLWVLWAGYNFANVCLRFDFVTGFTSRSYFAWLFFAKVIYMALFLIMLKRHERLTLKVLSLAIIFIDILFIFFSEANIISLNTREFERFYARGVVNPNTIAFWNVLLLILALYWLFKSPAKRFFGTSCGIFSITCIFMAASRTAAIPAAIILLITVYAYMRSKKVSLLTTISLTMILGMLFILILPHISSLQDSTLIARMNYREEEADKFQMPDSQITMLLGERSIYYYEGLEIFKLSPLFGIGYNNYIHYSIYGLRCHIEYIAQLVEGGIIGSTLYLLFLLTLIFPPPRGWPVPFENLFFYYGGSIALLMYGIGSYTSMKDCFYVLCALVLAYKKIGPQIAAQNSEEPAKATDKTDQSNTPGGAAPCV